jgi:uncharacterized SAM-binding protein YcdF (DUF218 family)
VDVNLLRMIAKAVVLPPTSLLLVSIVGLLLLRRTRVAGRVLAWLGVGILALISMPAVAWWLVSLLDAPPPFDPRSARDAQAIVILGAGIRPSAPEFGGDTLASLTLERVRYGAVLARTTGLPVLVSGGTVFGGPSEAELMRDALQSEFHVPVRWIEPYSRNTRENARYSARILRANGIERVVLVTHGFDAQRGSAEFRDNGIGTVAGATGLPAGGTSETIFDWLPSMSALRLSYYATYELLANFVRALPWRARPERPAR